MTRGRYYVCKSSAKFLIATRDDDHFDGRLHLQHLLQQLVDRPDYQTHRTAAE